MKDEKEGKIIGEFVGLKPKIYSIKNIDDKESCTAKGVILRLSLMNSKPLCSTKKILRHKMRRIQARRHKLGIYKINKISLFCFDDK